MTPHPAHVCIVGGGPAGLSVALGLLGTGLRVLLLEAGDERPRTSADVLGRVLVEGDDPYPQGTVDETRGCGLGGTANIWSFRMPDDPDEQRTGARGCRYAPLDAQDFERVVPGSSASWPIGRRDLDPWYERAQAVAGLGPFDYRPAAWASSAAPVLPGGTGLATGMFQFGPASAWTDRAVERLRRDPRVTIVTGALVTGLDRGPDGRTVVGVRYQDRSGGRARVDCRCVVLAAGGIENARLLLASRLDSASPTSALGAGFMEHPLVRGGLLLVPRGVQTRSMLGLYDARTRAGTKVMAKLTVEDVVVREGGLLSTAALLIPMHPVHATPGVSAVRTLRSPTGRQAPRRRKAALLAAAIRGAPDVARSRAVRRGEFGVDGNGWSDRADVQRVFELLLQTEQSPDDANRILLAPGQAGSADRPAALLRWHWSAQDRALVTRARDLYVAGLERAGLGTVADKDWDRGQPRRVAGTHHHMGGTRMSVDPRAGVVDPDCQVHDTRGLYVAGSSVFPTGGSVNPTLTIVALSLRLAAHLSTRVGVDDLDGRTTAA